MSQDEVVADYDVRSPASRTLLTVVGTVLVVAVIAGLVLTVSILKRSTTVSTSDVDLGRSTQIVVDAGSADVRLVQGDPGLVRVTARVTSGLRRTEFAIGRRGDEIKIVAGCQAWLNPGCGVQTTIRVPEGFPVTVRTTSGDVTVRDVSEGVLNVFSGSGDITGSGLKVDELFARTSSGDVTASFARQPFAFKARTSSGDIRGELAPGKRTYAVTATSTSGSVSSSIPSDEGGTGLIRATTSSGDVTLTR